MPLTPQLLAPRRTESEYNRSEGWRLPSSREKVADGSPKPEEGVCVQAANAASWYSFVTMKRSDLAT